MGSSTGEAVPLAESWNQRGLNLARAGSYVEAVNAFNSAIRLNSKVAQYHSNKGAALFGLGYATNQGRPGSGDKYYQESLEAFRRAINLDPDAPMIWHNIGVVFRYVGEYDTAIACQAVAVVLDPGFTDARVERDSLLRMSRG
jgi:tetratricopeptide (TPR) repeat protein